MSLLGCLSLNFLPDSCLFTRALWSPLVAAPLSADTEVCGQDLVAKHEPPTLGAWCGFLCPSPPPASSCWASGFQPQPVFKVFPIVIVEILCH